MCLAVFTLSPNSAWQWVIVANRDEEHARPSADMQPWPENPHILAGRDLRAGGTWLGVHSCGRLALLTNYREPGHWQPDAPSRGHLVEQFLRQRTSAQDYLESLATSAHDYNGFNLLVGQHLDWWHASNRADTWQQSIEPGFYGLSNALLDTPWPKVVRTREAVRAWFQKNQSDSLKSLALKPMFEQLTAIMRDEQPASDSDLPHTGVGPERERLLSSPFILSDIYGTRCTTVVLQHRSGILVAQESTYRPDGSMRSQSRWISHPDQGWSTLD